MDSEEEKRLAEEQERINRENQEKNSGNAYNNLRSAQKNINNLRRGARAGRVIGKQTARAGRAAAQGGRRAASQGGKIAARAGATAARIGAQLAAQAATATAELLAATSEVWVPVAAIIIAVVFFIMIITAAFTFFFSGTPVVSGGEPPPLTCADVSGTCETNCASPSVPDTSGATCSDPSLPTCCVTEPPPGALPPLHFYCQYDSKYTSNACNITKYGCDPTSIAMIITSFGDPYTPSQVGLINNIGCTGSTTFTQTKNVLYNWVAPKGYSTYQMGVNANNISVDSVRTRIDAGYYILALACMTYKSSGGLHTGGHSIVITGVNTNGTLRVADPTFCTSDNNYTIRNLDPTYPGPDIRNGCPNGAGGYWGGWGALYAIKK